MQARSGKVDAIMVARPDSIALDVFQGLLFCDSSMYLQDNGMLGAGLLAGEARD